MNTGLSDVLKSHFPDITPVPRPNVPQLDTLNPFWVSGFAEGECCFSITPLSPSLRPKGEERVFQNRVLC